MKIEILRNLWILKKLKYIFLCQFQEFCFIVCFRSGSLTALLYECKKFSSLPMCLSSVYDKALKTVVWFELTSFCFMFIFNFSSVRKRSLELDHLFMTILHAIFIFDTTFEFNSVLQLDQAPTPDCFPVCLECFAWIDWKVSLVWCL